MTDIAISVQGLGKSFRLGARREAYKTLRDQIQASLLRSIRTLSGKNRRQQRVSDTFWALRDISFEIRRGEAIGIIGRNGAGKSTLLKILSRITEPSEGYADIYGRVGSLLEVGTGFHAELTGRENIYLNGAILGMHKSEITRSFDEIVAFAEVERFIDTAVKHYSSGMYLRLAFAVAAHLNPETLLVDEVLAVGDAAFQKKCLGKMGEVANKGRTVVLVSHNMVAIESLCSRVLWLADGKVVEFGDAGGVVSRYLQAAGQVLDEQIWENQALAPGNDRVRLRRACVRPEYEPTGTPISIRTPYLLEFEYWNLAPGARLGLSCQIFNDLGTMVFNPATYSEPNWHGRPHPEGLYHATCFVPGDLMNDGTYRVELLVTEDDARIVCKFQDLLVYKVQDSPERRGAHHGKWPGAVRPDLKWETVAKSFNGSLPTGGRQETTPSLGPPHLAR